MSISYNFPIFEWVLGKNPSGKKPPNPKTNPNSDLLLGGEGGILWGGFPHTHTSIEASIQRLILENTKHKNYLLKGAYLKLE